MVTNATEKKIKQGRRVCNGSSEGVAVLNRVVGEGLLEKVTLKLEGDEDI